MSDQQFMTLGTHCSEEYCRQLDFLPFKCPCCSLPYCSDHWRPPSGHTCSKYDPNKEDNRIPSCPLCSTPIPHPPTTSPDSAMDAHLSATCPVLNPDAKAAFANPGGMATCQAARCRTKLVVPFACGKCGGKFCAPHRFDTDHACRGGADAKAGPGGGGRAGATAGGAGGRGMAGLAALRRAQATMKSAAKPATTKAKTTNSVTSAPIGTKANPLVIDDSDDDVPVVAPNTRKTAAKPGPAKTIAAATNGVLGSKTDKRAAAERTSARKALEARAKKGLLTEKEKLAYATERALEAESKNTKNGDGCCLS